MFLLSTKYFEDEFNAFFQCSLRGYIRQYLPTDLCVTKSLFDFYNILGQRGCNVTRKISNFIFHMLKKKRNSLTI